MTPGAIVGLGHMGVPNARNLMERTGSSAAVFASGQLAFAKALAGGSGDVGTACARDQASGMSLLSRGDAS
jgi:3-hydroxyisobutyrate dehydrogenase-like beta-hydroxyacid dehydrogenase